MAKIDYKKAYQNISGAPLEKVKSFISKYKGHWDLEEFEEMIKDVLKNPSSTAEDVVDILALIIEQQGGNLEFKRAFFTLKAEVLKSYQRIVPKKPVDEKVVDVEEPDAPPVEEDE